MGVLTLQIILPFHEAAAVLLAFATEESFAPITALRVASLGGQTCI